MSLFTSCFPSRPTHQPLRVALPPPSSPVRVASCVFCDIPANVPSSSILFEDESFYVFKDRSGGARQHLLCIPKAESVQDLSSEDISLLQRMSTLSLSVLAVNSSSPVPPPAPPRPSSSPPAPTPEPNFLLGFHIPPLTSVPHLHLHAFELPFDDLRNRIEFRSTERRGGVGKIGKGMGWFVSAKQTMDMLEAGVKVTVGRGKVPPKAIYHD